jgi:glycerol-3-phosphate dehydrogenase
MTARPALATLPDQAFDLVVIGAGINGCGIARDAARRGLRVLLVDKGDIGGGTTSWSTRLIHGGLRYLEHGEIGLVRESLRERERLLRIAPHLVRPLPLLLPIYEGDRRGTWLIRAGMLAYDLLSYDKSLPRYQMLSREEALARAPGLNPHGLRGAALYYDAQVQFPERLAVENALAARAAGATVLTYTKVRRILKEAGAVRGVELANATDEQRVAVSAPVVVNVAGPWVDAVLAADPAVERVSLIGGTKGSHLVVGAFPGAPQDALYAAAREDARPFFIIPWNSQYLIGTTDLRFTGDPDRIRASAAEIDYLLTEANRLLPTAGLDRQEIHYTYAGVRPLPFVSTRAAGAITRRHVLHDHAASGVKGLVSIIGGKLTTYRELAQQTVDWAQRALERPVTQARTGDEPLPGAYGLDGDLDSFRRRFAIECGVPERSAEHLLDVYGSRASDVLALATNEGLRRPFDPWSGAIGAEVVYAFEVEGAVTLTDALMRRTMVGLGPDLGIGADNAAAALAASYFGWTATRRHQEIAAYRAYVERFDVMTPDEQPVPERAARRVPVTRAAARRA